MGYTYDWIASAWSQCDAPCGEFAVKSRFVLCERKDDLGYVFQSQNFLLAEYWSPTGEQRAVWRSRLSPHKREREREFDREHHLTREHLKQQGRWAGRGAGDRRHNHVGDDHLHLIDASCNFSGRGALSDTPVSKNSDGTVDGYIR
jgi:hypothetical protein